MRRFLLELKKLFPKPKIVLEYTQPHELLFAVILSAQTTDIQVNKVTKKLFLQYPRLEDYVKAEESIFGHDIRHIGLWRAKAHNILATAKKLYNEYQGVIPKDLNILLSFPGVGRKTGNVVLAELYGKASGIAVDTHVRRLSRLFGFTQTFDPKKIEKDLMKVVPKPEWLYFTHRMILYGRKYCTARCKHEYCPLQKFILIKKDMHKKKKVARKKRSMKKGKKIQTARYR